MDYAEAIEADFKYLKIKDDFSVFDTNSRLRKSNLKTVTKKTKLQKKQSKRYCPAGQPEIKRKRREENVICLESYYPDYDEDLAERIFIENLAYTQYSTYYRLKSGDTVRDCALMPTEVEPIDSEYIWAKNDKYGDDYDNTKVGKWIFFRGKEEIDWVWEKTKEGIRQGVLWKAAVTTSGGRLHELSVYTRDYTNVNDVIHILNYLERVGIAPVDKVLKYRTDEQTREELIRDEETRKWEYLSDRIRRYRRQRH